LAETYDEQIEREMNESVARITEKQLRIAQDIASRVFGSAPDPELVGTVAQVMAINLSTLRRKR
jgi:hypothetical protein